MKVLRHASVSFAAHSLQKPSKNKQKGALVGNYIKLRGWTVTEWNTLRLYKKYVRLYRKCRVSKAGASVSGLHADKCSTITFHDSLMLKSSKLCWMKTSSRKDDSKETCFTQTVTTVKLQRFVSRSNDVHGMSVKPGAAPWKKVSNLKRGTNNDPSYFLIAADRIQVEIHQASKSTLRAYYVESI